MLTPKANVLIIEDSTDTGELLVVALTSAGYGVRLVSTRDDALTVLKNNIYGCVLMDYSMDGMTAEAFISSLSIDMRSKVVLMTASAEVEDLAKRLGVRACLAKPFEIEVMLECVQRYCDCE